MSDGDTVWVFADWQGLGGARLVGALHRAVTRGEEVLSFEYDPEWLTGEEPLILDPKLQFVEGRQYAETAFGIFLDSAPDRWGRLLIQRREAIRAAEEGRQAERLFDSDYLLAVSDISRLGGLRFKLEGEGPFLAEDTPFSIPPLTALRELEHASINFEKAEAENLEYGSWLQMLLAPGSSLGGARPKSSVVDPDGQLWIAKFPSRNDSADVGAWEGLVYELAKKAGLRTVEARVEAFSGEGHTFLIKRFDRLGQKRIHFASAMNLLGYQDGDGAKTGASYLDLVDLIERMGFDVAAELEELWKRIVFNICVNNTDDHLRNHGFIANDRGWRLSPVYDINPQPWGGGLALNIDESSNACELDLTRQVGKFFRLTRSRQDQIIIEVKQSVSQWESLAQARGFRRPEVEQMRPAFTAID